MVAQIIHCIRNWPTVELAKLYRALGKILEARAREAAKEAEREGIRAEKDGEENE